MVGGPCGVGVTNFDEHTALSYSLGASALTLFIWKGVVTNHDVGAQPPECIMLNCYSPLQRS